MDTGNLEYAAQIAALIIKLNVSSDDLHEIIAGANPHDYFDANLALYGAFTSTQFDEPDLNCDGHVDFMNSAFDKALVIIRGQEAA